MTEIILFEDHYGVRLILRPHLFHENVWVLETVNQESKPRAIEVTPYDLDVIVEKMNHAILQI